MRNSVLRLVATASFAAVLSACSSAPQTGAAATPAPQAAAPAASGKATLFQYPHTAADVHFMSGMIPHHAQAVKIAGWAPTRSTSPGLRVLCERIVVGQRDEIALMQTWLMDRNLPVPDSNATHLRMTMGGMQHDMLMPGMLNDQEMAQLERARGTEFDRLFLLAMIKHHEGAITMVDQLFASPGAGQDETVFRFASDVYADQTTEIDRMQKMLAGLPAGGRSP